VLLTSEQIQSAFMIDLQQVSLAINSTTSRSLLIIDEFGKGTDSHGKRLLIRMPLHTLLMIIDGIGLACGIFEYLLSLGKARPKILAATHFHEIFEQNFLRNRSQMVLGHMSFQVDETASTIEDQIIYLYK
jgi:DNA mismatch repair protein MSH5